MRAPSRRGVRRRRVLVADASSATLLWARLLLQESNVDLVVARDGEAAIALALVEHPDLILLDVHLPVTNGLDACRFIRGTPAVRDIPIVMIISRAEERAACFASGGSDVVTKPFDRSLFRRTIQRWLDRAPALTLASSTTVGPLLRADRTMRPLLRVVRTRTMPRPLRTALRRGLR